jgi:hypothetical protein
MSDTNTVRVLQAIDLGKLRRMIEQEWCAYRGRKTQLIVETTEQEGVLRIRAARKVLEPFLKTGIIAIVRTSPPHRTEARWNSVKPTYLLPKDMDVEDYF